MAGRRARPSALGGVRRLGRWAARGRAPRRDVTAVRTRAARRGSRPRARRFRRARILALNHPSHRPASGGARPNRTARRARRVGSGGALARAHRDRAHSRAATASGGPMRPIGARGCAPSSGAARAAHAGAPHDARLRRAGRTLLAVAIRSKRDADAVTDAPPTLADVLDAFERARLGHRALRARRARARLGSLTLLELGPTARPAIDARARSRSRQPAGARARQRRAARARLARGRVRADARTTISAQTPAAPGGDDRGRPSRLDSDDEADALIGAARLTRAAAWSRGLGTSACAADGTGQAGARSHSTASLCSSAWFRAATAAPFRPRASRRRRRGALAGPRFSAATR